MPELPEVESLKRSLEPRLIGARVVRVRVIRGDVITRLEDPAAARDRGVKKKPWVLRRERRSAELLEGDTIVELRRHGKQLAILGASGRVVCFHLGMSGQVRLIEGDGARLRLPPKLAKHVHCAWRLQLGSSAQDKSGDAGAAPGESGPARGVWMLFRDPRRFGGIWTARDLATLARERWSNLGPDALAITTAELAGRLAGRDRPIKAALLDQSILAGVGNIYADEALFRSGIHPGRRAAKLTRGEVAALASAVRHVLQASIRKGGTTVRDYVDAAGAEGGFVPRLAVYGRAGDRCLTCGRALSGDVVAQRTTVFCRSCQPRWVRI